MDIYKVNDTTQEVKLEVQAGVLGIAESRVYLGLIGNFQKIITSEELENGNIPFARVDVNNELSNMFIHIRTVANFSNILEGDEREKAIKNMRIEYLLNGGAQGLMNYHPTSLDIVRVSDTIVFVNKLIKFE